MEAFAEGSLLFFLSQVPDLRDRRGRQHPLSAVLALTCCAILCGARSFAAIGEWGRNYPLEFMHRLGFTRWPPKSGGIRKVLIHMDVLALENAVEQWIQSLLGELPTPEQPPLGVAIDGKTARGSFDKLHKAIHLLSLMAHRSGLTLAQCEVPNGGEDKTNEHKASLPLLQRRTLEGLVITGDAMFCHRDVCSTILDRKGDYFLFVKENQPTLLRDIQAALAPPKEGAFSPSARATLARGEARGEDARQGARPTRTTHLPHHHGPQ